MIGSAGRDRSQSSWMGNGTNFSHGESSTAHHRQTKRSPVVSEAIIHSAQGFRIRFGPSAPYSSWAPPGVGKTELPRPWPRASLTSRASSIRFDMTSNGEILRLPTHRGASRLCRLQEGVSHSGGPEKALFRGAVRRGGKGPSRGLQRPASGAGRRQDHRLPGRTVDFKNTISS